MQIAGLIARRIVPFVKEGDTIATGERFGLIRFGSRVDVYLPIGVVPLVGEGQTAIAGETVLADLSGGEAPVRAVPRDLRRSGRQLGPRFARARESRRQFSPA